MVLIQTEIKYNAKETITAFPAKYFTTIVINRAGKAPISESVDAIRFIAHDHNLRVKIDGKNITYNEADYETVKTIIKQYITNN